MTPLRGNLDALARAAGASPCGASPSFCHTIFLAPFLGSVSIRGSADALSTAWGLQHGSEKQLLNLGNLMKTIKGVLSRSLFIASLAAVIIVLGIASVHAQPVPPLPPSPTNLPPPLTPEQIAALQAALAAQQAALYQAEYQPWAVQDLAMP